MSRRVIPGLLAPWRLDGRLLLALASVLLWLAYLATAGDAVLGEKPVRPALGGAALALSCLAAILFSGRLLEHVLSGGHVGAVTSFHRSLLYAGLVGLGVASCLAFLGFDLRVALATSALGSAIVGLAMQPMLTSVIGGLTLNIDRVVRVGDSIVLGPDTVRVEALTWRNVHARRRDGTLVVVPNTRLSDAELRVRPRDGALRLDIPTKVAAVHSPGRVAAVVLGLIGDLPALDEAHPPEVVPLPHDADAEAVPYAVRVWARHVGVAEALEAEVVRRLFCGLRRHGLVAAPAPTEAELRALLPLLDGEARAALRTEAVVLAFAGGERLELPWRFAGHSFVLLGGVVDLAEEYLPDPRPMPPQLGPDFAQRQMVRVLAAEIGPYAAFAVRQAAAAVRDPDAMVALLAEEIPDAAGRARFLAACRPGPAARFAPGAALAFTEAAEGLVLLPRAVARGEVRILAVPPAQAGLADMAAALAADG